MSRRQGETIGETKRGIQLRTVRLIGFSGFLSPKTKGFSGKRWALKIATRFSSKKSPVLEIDNIHDIAKVIQAIESNRFVAKRLSVHNSDRGDIFLSIRDWVILTDGEIVFDDRTDITGELALVRLHNKDTNMTSKHCFVSGVEDMRIVGQCIAISGSGCNNEQFKIFVRKPQEQIQISCVRHTSCGNSREESYSI